MEVVERTAMGPGGKAAGHVVQEVALVMEEMEGTWQMVEAQVAAAAGMVAELEGVIGLQEVAADRATLSCSFHPKLSMEAEPAMDY